MNGKIRNIALLVSAVFMFFSCVGEPKATPNRGKAEEVFQRVWGLYRIPKYGLFSEYYPGSHRPDLTYSNDPIRQTQEISYLWLINGVSSPAVLMVVIEPEKYTVYVDSMVMAMEHYYDTTYAPFDYQAYPVQFGKVDRHYDDNGLVGINYIDPYPVTKNLHYPKKAKQVLTFILSGWDKNLEGTVSWLERVKDQKPVCSNGKAMVLALELYRATKDNYYLEVGRRFYRWIDKYLKDPERGVVWSSWSTMASTVCPDLYTYNTGILLQTAVALHNYTGEQAYLDNAKFLAEESYKVSFKYTEEGTPYIADLPRFNLVLFRGYHDLYNVTGDPKYVDTMAKELDYAWDHVHDQAGSTYHNWTGRTDEKRQPKWLLDTPHAPEYYARAAMIKEEVKTEE